jgi:hypothetical protein
MLCTPTMHLRRRFATGTVCLSALSAPAAWAQDGATSPPETLETPYEEPIASPPPPEAAPAPPPLSPPVETAAPGAEVFPPPPPADTRPRGPIRAQRRLALTAELGWNGLAGFGPVLTYHAHPHASFDLGGGFSLFGWKAGLRGRYNLLTANFTPFLGLGFNASSGFGEQTFQPEDDPQGGPKRDPVTLDLKPSYLMQTTLGFDYVHRRGFTLIGALGYALLLNEDNLDILDGELSEDEQRAVDVFFKSGIVISAAVGYSFE